MKKLVLFLLPAMMLAGCSQEIDLAQPAGGGIEETAPPLTRSLAGAVYNEVVDTWMVPQPDPFTLENIQAAYDKLAAGRSAQTLTAAQSAGFPAGKKLAPTHYALKIYPKSEEEQWRVEMMEDVNVAYIPFDYVQLTQEEAGKVERSGKTRSAANTFAEKSPYTITYENYETTDGRPTGPVTFQLPILYTVWPASKPLPDDLEYVMDYPVFLPSREENTDFSKSRIRKAVFSIEAMNVLETEAISLALGDPVIPPDPGFTFLGYSGILETYDDFLNANVPMASIKVSAQLGSMIEEGITNRNGLFKTGNFGVPFVSVNLSLTLTYQDAMGRWKITTENSTTPYTVNISAQATSDGLPPETVLPAGNRQANEIYRAARYFFNEQTDFPKETVSGGLRIIAYAASSPSEGAFCWYENYTSVPWIEIFNNNRVSSKVVGTTLHELGHSAHYLNGRSGANANYYQETLKGLRESFAPYVSCYLGESYYTSLGWVKPPVSSYYPLGDITGDSRQTWVKTKQLGGWQLGEYTPLFVDLKDDYNQKVYYNPASPNDAIGGVPTSVIWNAITTSKTWRQCKDKLQSYVGTYYTATEFNNWIADFEYWFAQPYNQVI